MFSAAKLFFKAPPEPVPAAVETVVDDSRPEKLLSICVSTYNRAA